MLRMLGAVAFQRAIDSIERNYNTIESMLVSIEQLTAHRLSSDGRKNR